MNRNHIIIAVGGIVFLLIVGIGFLSFSGMAPELTPEQKTKLLLDKAPQLSQLPPPEQQEVIQAIITTEDLEKCEFAKGVVVEGYDYYQGCRDNINLALAIQKKDITFCKGVSSNISGEEMCVFEVSVALAIEKDSPDACAAILSETNRNLCLERYWTRSALKNNDQKLCANLGRGEFKCVDAMLISKLIQSESAVSCNDFKTTTSKRDCINYKKVLESPSDINLTCEIESLELHLTCLQKQRSN